MLLASLGSSAHGQINTIDKSWHFNVFLDDRPIGYHSYQLEKSGNEYRLSIKAELDVKLLFLSVYTYIHKNNEVWDGQCLTSLSSTTNDNGDREYVTLQRLANEVFIKTKQETKITDECVRSFAYWNPELLSTDRLLNAQNGQLIDVTFSHVGKEEVDLNGHDVVSDRYRLRGENIEIDLWYSATMEWLALQSVTEDGYLLRYERQAGVEP
jgi:hypothetical protein